MAAAMDTSDPCLEAQRQAHPELGNLLDNLVKYSNSKLYHQLSLALFEYLSQPVFKSNAANELLEFFNGFIKPYESKFDKVKWVQLLQIICRQQEPDKALELIMPFEEGVKGHRDAKYLWQTLKAEKLIFTGKLDEAHDLLDILNKEIDSAYEVDALIQSTFQKTFALLWKHLGRPHKFYQSSIIYLAFTPLTAIPEEERPQLAFEIGVAALISEEEFNFGELLTQDLIKKCLDGTQHAWVQDLLVAFGDAKFELYDTAVKKHMAAIEATPELKGKEATVLRPKMAALALMDLAFRKPKKQRRLTFKEIEQHCRVQPKEVELLVMKAMCAKLIKGTIDEVNSLVTVSWVMPRMLDKERVDLMCHRMQEWAEATEKDLKELEEMTPELLVL